jgi:hypothetical protein
MRNSSRAVARLVLGLTVSRSLCWPLATALRMRTCCFAEAGHDRDRYVITVGRRSVHMRTAA